MTGDAGSGGAREVLLAAVAAFGPWRPSDGGSPDRGAARSFTPGMNAPHAQ